MQEIKELGNITFNLAALIISITCILYTLMMRTRRKLRNALFILLILIVSVDSLSGILIELGNNDYAISFAVKYYWNYTWQFIYFITHFAIAPILAIYIILYCNVSFRFSNRLRTLIGAPFAILLLMVISNPFTHLVFTLDNNLVFHRQIGVYIAYGVSAFYLLFSIVALYLYWNVFNRAKKIALAYFFILVATGTITQMLVFEIRSELFCEAIGLMGLMIMVENDEDRLDISTWAYNRNAFLNDVNTYFKYNRRFYAICIRIKNAEVYRKITGYEEFEKILFNVVKFLNGFNSKFEVYRVSANCFFLICPDVPKFMADKAATSIFKRFSEEWIYHGSSLHLKTLIFEASCPDQFKNLEYLMLLSDSQIEKDSDKVYQGDDLNFILRRADVETAVKRGIENKSFAVYYKPVYYKEDLSIYGAESILKFTDKELGEISADEFMPIAEETGMIERLGWFNIEQVFALLGTGMIEEMGIEVISIGLSSVQMLKADFANKVQALLTRYGVTPSRIAFYISENTAVNNQDVINAAIKQLDKVGVRFIIDQFGAGLFSMNSASFPIYNGVRMSSANLVQAALKKQNRIILDNRIEMLNQLGKSITIDDVDDQEIMELCGSVNADYMQGAYFSDIVSKNELISILRATALAKIEEQRARAANEAKSNFLANMSHEIRTPINAVLGMNEVILRECKDEKILEYAQNIDGAGRTLLSLINDILDFSKIEAGSMEITEVPYEFSSVLNDVYNMVHIKAEQKALKLNFFIDEELPDSLFGDEMRLRQILVNVLNNGVKYTNDGSVTLKVSGERTGKETLILKMDVIDTGEGIKEEDLDTLFDKFKRVDMEKNRTVEGSGLGLAITSSLLELMKGSISVDSEYGKGSVFSITLPQKVMAENPIGDFRLRIQEANKHKKAFDHGFIAPDAKILVVDDTPMNHVVIRELLKPTKVIIESARSGQAGIDKQKETKYDLIFLDYRMPGLDGIETLRIMRQDKQGLNINTPVIVLTANAISGAKENFLKEGFDDYLSKPVESAKLEEVLLNYLPKEKIDYSAPETGDNNTGSKSDWMDKLEQIDSSQGLKNCGSAESYLSIIKVFYESIKYTRENIENSYAENNIKDYTSYVHSLKSTSRTIGAMELSRLSKVLEDAGNNNDLETINNLTPQLLNMYSIVEYGLSKIPEIAGERHSEQNEDMKEISSEQLEDGYNTILEISASLDYDMLMFVLSDLKKYKLPPQDAKSIKKIDEMAKRLDWDGIKNIVNSRLKEKEN